MKKTLKEKAETVLAAMYGGLHNVPGKIKDLVIRIEVTVPCHLSTYDFDGLTRLVVVAHDECVRPACAMVPRVKSSSCSTTASEKAEWPSVTPPSSKPSN